MRIAVSGASGFIGRHVLRELRSRGLDAIALTRSVSGRHPQPGASRWLECDIANPLSNPFEAMGSPDVLIHLAWGGLPNYQSSHHVEVELPAQQAFLSACVRNGLKRLVVTGTCYEYGLAEGELAEDASTQPCTQYGVAKGRLRNALSKLSRELGFDMAWLRLFYLYGEGQSEKSLYRSLHAAIERGDKAFDMSGGEQVRDFLPIQVAARIIVDIALREDATGTFNVCSGNPITVKDMVESWIAASHAAITLNLDRIPYSPNEPMAFWGSRCRLDHALAII
jgi:dTDP-6-deoxy-L-talose 4-dehydrogenase (NAD+)